MKNLLIALVFVILLVGAAFAVTRGGAGVGLVPTASGTTTEMAGHCATGGRTCSKAEMKNCAKDKSAPSVGQTANAGGKTCHSGAK